jgi:hypothetical protein
MAVFYPIPPDFIDRYTLTSGFLLFYSWYGILAGLLKYMYAG